MPCLVPNITKQYQLFDCSLNWYEYSDFMALTQVIFFLHSADVEIGSSLLKIRNSMSV